MIGYTPAQVDEMSVWEFGAVIEGYNKAHGDNKPQPPTEEEFEAAISRTMH